MPRRLVVTTPASTEKVIAAGSAAFPLSGQLATLRRGLRLSASPASFPLSGQAATFRLGKSLVAGAASFPLSGQAATLRTAKKIAAAPASFPLIGQAATLTKSVPATRTFINTFNDETDATSYTASGASIGSADATRAIVVAVMNRVSAGGASAPTSVTVAGISATKLVDQAASGDRNAASIWIAAVPTGTTGNIVADFGGVTQQRCGMGWWATYNLSSLSAYSTPNKTDVSGGSIAVNSAAGGLVFGAGNAGQGTAATFTWTGLTEDFDVPVGSGNGWMTGASLETASASTPLAITCTVSGTPANDQYCAVALR